MKKFAVLLIALLAGCALLSDIADTVQSQPVVTGPESAGRRAVCIGLDTTADGQDCPGAGIDARTVASWTEDRRTVLLIDRAATLSQVQQTIRAANAGMGSNDLLTVSISGHGTQRPDGNGDEPDGMDEGAVLWDATWWDDDVWTFVCTLRPCRLELITDTCHAAGNWRRWVRPMTFGIVDAPRQLEFDLRDDRAEARGEWGGQLIQFAGCREDSCSYGDAAGGTLTQTLDTFRTNGVPRNRLFALVEAAMPDDQKPVWSTYRAGDAFIAGPFLDVPATPVPPPLPPPPDAFNGSFLRRDASRPYGRMMGLLSTTWSDDQFAEALSWHRTQGDSTLLLALADVGDNGAPVTLYDNAYGGAVDSERVEWMQERCDRIRRAGFGIWFWLTLDDLRPISQASRETHLRHADLCIEHFGYAASAWCSGLEIREDGRKNHAEAITRHLNDATVLPVYIHYARGDWRQAQRDGADGIAWQSGFGRSYEDMKRELQRAANEMQASWPGGLLHFTEYDRDSRRGYGPRMIRDVPTLTGYGNG